MDNTEYISWKNHRVRLNRKLIKNIIIKILPPGEIVVSVPRSCSQKSVLDFLDLKEKWVEQHLEKVKERNENSPEEGFDGEHLWYFGKCLKVIFRVAPEQAGKALLYENGVVFNSKRMLTNIEREKMVREFYRMALQRETKKLFAHWEPIMGVYSSKVTIRLAKSRWGSCNILTRAIMINERLAYRPRECLEYVVVHELNHLYEAGHGPRFKALMDRFLPDWRERKQLLNNFIFKNN